MSRSNRNGLSLVEAVVILAVLAVMLGLLLPALQAAQIFARRANCMNNLKMIGLACHKFSPSSRSAESPRIAPFATIFRQTG